MYVHAEFGKGRGTRDQVANIRWIIEKAKEFQKNIYFYFIYWGKAFDCVDHNKLSKFNTALLTLLPKTVSPATEHLRQQQHHLSS